MRQQHALSGGKDCMPKDKYFVLSWHLTGQPWLDMVVLSKHL
jgi:hypothetical protein